MMESPTFDILKELLGKESLEQGLQQGFHRALIDVLRIKFDLSFGSLINAIDDVDDAEVLSALHRHALRSNSIEEFEKKMKLMREG